ncbi:DNA/RNA helicase domain-containing protein [Streptomyces sp. NBC_01465]|uniref:DNA/RNA helicase domain-containing protein n=1 Tax=Streptomyces sp. NBC_01465 TaxID=2903878 RepID=UPI002E3189A8|nr:DNA/RNA helicase domain-containing protein [Streptomyces sp. NBC_01465]
MHLHGGRVADVARDVTQAAFIEACERRFLKVFGFAPSADEVRSWRRSWPALMSALCSAGLGELRVLLEFSLPATGERIDALVIGEAPDGRLCTVVIELKQWTTVQTSRFRPGMAKIGQRTVQHPARQVRGYVRYLEDWVSRDEFSLWVRGLTVLHDAGPELIGQLQEGVVGGAAGAFPLLGRDDLAAEPSREALAERLGCASLQPASQESVKVFLDAEHRPSPALLARAGQVIEGNDAFTLLGDQDLALQEVWHAVKASQERGKRSTIVVTGGPGTGKTVIACRLLGELCREAGANPRLLSPSGTLTRQLQRTVGDTSRGLIATFTDRIPAGVTADSVVLLDEAHRSRTYPDHSRAAFPLTLGKLLNRASVAVLFLDEQQIVRPTEGVTLDELTEHARDQDRYLGHIDLTTQFRCNGSSGYHRWIDQFLQPQGLTAPWSGSDYDLAVAGDPDQFTAWIGSHTDKGLTARMTAGFCWPWESPDTPPLRPEVELTWSGPQGPRTWVRPWNARMDTPDLDYPQVPARPYWATDEGGHEQVGCIYTAQGMEYAYNVVIIGKDLVRRGDKWVAQPEESCDKAFKGISPERYLRFALNTYRVLATRGTRGTRLWSNDEQTQAHLEALLPHHDRRPGQG